MYYSMWESHEQSISRLAVDTTSSQGAVSATKTVVESSVSDVGLFASLGIDGSLLVIQFVNFALVFLTVWFLILKPLVKKMEERKFLIDESLDRAKIIETNLSMSQVKFDEKIAEAQIQSNKLIADAQIEASRFGERIKDDARKEVEGLVAEAKKNIAHEKKIMEKELREETIHIVLMVAEKLLGEKLDARTNTKFVEEMLTTITPDKGSTEIKL